MKNTRRTILPMALALAGTLAAPLHPFSAAAADSAPDIFVHKTVVFAAYSPAIPMVTAGTPCAAVEAVDAIASGNVGALDALLDAGRLGIDEVMAISWYGGSKTLDATSKAWDLQDHNYAPAAMGNPVLFGGWTVHEMPAFGASHSVLHGTPLMVAARFGNARMVRHLLDRGANPNVFIQVGGAMNGIMDLYCDGRRIDRPWLFALLETYRKTPWNKKPADKKDEIARMLVEAGAVLPPEDGYGRNGLWDASIARSVPMLEMALAAGLDINAEDYSGHAVAECKPVVTGDADWEAFSRVLRGHGATGGDTAAPEPSRGFDAVPPKALESAPATSPTPALSPAFPSTGTSRAPAPDHSAEIAQLELRLRTLRSQLVDAQHDADMAAVNGTGWIVAGMRVSNIQREISETEGRLLELQP